MKTCPRCAWAASWISSTARKSTSRSTGIASTVATQYEGRARDALLFAGDEGDLRSPTRARDPVVDLAREQAQREPDHPASRARASARSRDASCPCSSGRAAP